MIMKGYARPPVTPYAEGHGAENLPGDASGNHDAGRPRDPAGRAWRPRGKICGKCNRPLGDHNLEELYLCVDAAERTIHGGRT